MNIETWQILDKIETTGNEIKGLMPEKPVYDPIVNNYNRAWDMKPVIHLTSKLTMVEWNILLKLVNQMDKGNLIPIGIWPSLSENRMTLHRAKKKFLEEAIILDTKEDYLMINPGLVVCTRNRKDARFLKECWNEMMKLLSGK